MRVQRLVNSAPAQPLAGRNAVHRGMKRRTRAPMAARNNSPATESLGMLEAFFIGRALAETVNERLGSVVGDAVAEIGRIEAELRRSIQDFQDEVMFRAQKEMAASAGGDGSSMMGGGSGNKNDKNRGALVAPPDVAECVDNLRAEVASARALVQQIKQKPPMLK
ncbi:hypothetical protein Ndes2526B_g06004 [Nannochloris sp. 'desiccata']|nr:hypothetical protein NADE_005901 [Chlorella desiccata (nom. nud.)]